MNRPVHMSLVLLVLLGAVRARAAGGTWNVDASGNWSTAADWTPAAVPGTAAGDVVGLTYNISAARTITVDTTTRSVGVLKIGDSGSAYFPYTLTNSAGAILTFNNSGHGAGLAQAVTTAADVIALPLTLADNLNITNSSTLTLSGVIGDGGAGKFITVTGAGTLILSGASTFGGGGTNNGGTIVLAASTTGAAGAVTAGPVGTGPLTLNGGVLSPDTGAGRTNANAMVIAAGGTNTFGSSLTSQSLTLTGAWSGTGTVQSQTAVPAAVYTVYLLGNLGGFAGTLIYTGVTSGNGANWRLGAGGSTCDLSQAAVVLNGGNGKNFGYQDGQSAATLNLGSLSGNGYFQGSWFYTGSGAVDSLVVGFLNTSTTFSGQLGVSGQNMDNFALTKVGTGTLTLSGPNVFTGGVNLNGGVLNAGSAQTGTTSGPLGASGTISFGGGTLQFSAASGAWDPSPRFSTAAGQAVSIDTAGQSLTFAAALTGNNGTLTLTNSTGAGTLTLTGNDSFGGGTLINGGILALPSAGVLTGGAVTVAANAGAQLVVSGGSLTATNSSNLGAGSDGLLVSGGSASFAGGLTTDLGNDSGHFIEVTGGALLADSLAMGRDGTKFTAQPTAGSTTSGLYIDGGTVTVTNDLDMSDSPAANSSVSTRIDSGSLTVDGVLTIGLNNGTRWSVVDVNGGTLSVPDTITGIDVGGTNTGNAELLVRAGTATAGIISFGQAAPGSTNMTAVVNLTGGSLYVGAGGLVQLSAGAGFVPAITLNGGTLGATADWSSSLPLTLGGATLQAADSSGVAHNISLSGGLSGTGALTKTGAGQLTISGACTYSGNTIINAGTLSLGAGNILPNTGAFTLNGGTFASAGYTDTAGTLTLQSSSSLVLGTNTSGTLTFAGGSYTAGTLTISNWNGTAGQSGTADRIFITNAPSATFLNHLTFALYQPGAIRLGTGEIVPSGSLTTNLAITSVNGGSTPTAGTPFSVVVQSQGLGGTAQNVTADTAVSLSLNTGAGALGGTLTGTILSGTSSVTLSGVTYTKAQSGVILTATRTSGLSLTPGNSSAFSVNPGAVSAAQSTVTAGPTSVVANDQASSTITVTLNDAIGNPVSGKTVTLAKSGGSSAISAASGSSGVNGVVTFTVHDAVAETATYTATDTTDGVTPVPTASVTFTALPWYNTAWRYCLTLQINCTNVSGTLTNFPMLVNLTNSSLALSAQTNGYDILFTAGDGTNKLAHEIESYTSSNGLLTAWVNVPLLSSAANTNIYLYFGNAAATNQQNVGGTWDANFKAVWHLEPTAGNFTDSTTNGNTGTNNVSATGKNGKIANGQAFNGAGDYIAAANSPGLIVTQRITLSAWVNYTAFPTNNTYADIVDKNYDGNVDGYYLRAQNFTGSNTLSVGSYLNSASTNYCATWTITGWNTNEWHQVAGLYDGANWTLYGDGVQKATLAQGTGALSNAQPVTIGAFVYNGVYSRFSKASLDEVRISNTARSAGWISTEYANQNSPGTFYSLGNPESQPPAALAITSVNGGVSPTYGTAFNVVVQAQDANGNPANVVTNTTVTLSLAAGTGALGGTLAGVITNGTSSLTFSGITCTVAQSGLVLAATRRSGDGLTAGSSSAFTESPAPVTITSGIMANTKVYDSTTTATISSNAVTLNGVMSGDTANVKLATNSYTATFASAGVGTAIGVTVSGLTLTGSAAVNYTLTQPAGLTANITVATVTITSGLTANNKVYDTTAAATLSSNNVVLGGVMSGDTANVKLATNSYTATFASAGAGSGISVTVSGLTLTGSAVANYMLTQPAGLTANITAVTVTITSGVTANNKVYDGTTAATISSNAVVLSGVLSGDTANVKLATNNYTAVFASAGAGTGIGVTVSGLTLTGSACANYTFTQPTGLTANITTAGSTNVVSTSANPSPTGSNVTFTATVTAVPPGGGTPTGTVQFVADGAALGAAVTLSGGGAGLTVNSLAPGTHVITAQYAGDGNFFGSTNTLTPEQVIDRAPVTGSNTVTRHETTGAKVRVTALLANDSDPDGDTLSLYSVAATSGQGGTVATNNGWVFYTPPAGGTNADSFSYVITDGTLQATGLVAVVIINDTNAAQNIELSQNLGAGGFQTSFFGIPERTYTIQYTTNLASPGWQPLGTAAANATGWFQFTDAAGTNPPPRSYRSTYP